LLLIIIIAGEAAAAAIYRPPLSLSLCGGWVGVRAARPPAFFCLALFVFVLFFYPI
jgi:hypothetical protein